MPRWGFSLAPGIPFEDVREEDVIGPRRNVTAIMNLLRSIMMHSNDMLMVTYGQHPSCNYKYVWIFQING